VARSLRIEYPGAVYHVTSRGNARGALYRSDGDRALFLETLACVVSRYRWLCHAYCLLGNHYHLIVETPRPSLSLGMRRLNSTYAQAFNRRHGRVGHLFQGRYKAIIVEKERHLLELCRYVVLNPVRARLAATAGEWPWSSYRATAGEAEGPAFLTTAWVLGHFGERAETARRRYRVFVSEGLGQEPWRELHAQLYLGSDEFLRRLTPATEPLADVPRRQQNPLPASLAVLFATHGERAAAIAHRDHGYRLREIADFLGLHSSTVSRRLRRLEEQEVSA
jgi:putative transposase